MVKYAFKKQNSTFFLSTNFTHLKYTSTKEETSNHFNHKKIAVRCMHGNNFIFMQREKNKVFYCYGQKWFCCVISGEYDVSRSNNAGDKRYT